MNREEPNPNRRVPPGTKRHVVYRSVISRKSAGASLLERGAIAGDSPVPPARNATKRCALKESSCLGLQL